MEIAVYCGSSTRVDSSFLDVATSFGLAMGQAGHTLLYGGGDIGLMGALARAVHAAGGRVVGVIPDALRAIEGVAYEVSDELIVTSSMQERKRTLFQRADGFVALPGGIGTLEEFAEVATLRKLGFLDRPIVLVNTHGYYDSLLRFLDETVEKRFSGDLEGLFDIAIDVPSALACLSRP